VRLSHRFFALLGLLALSACSTFEQRDSAPPIRLDPDAIPDAVPRFEVIGRAGNRSPYEVLGKTYHLLPSPVGYVEEGEASWYGTKFHGRRTSNGEVFDMYAMTAAHKTLPIPCYAKITNLENGRTAVVRINDRGPFHSDRLIDLSFAAATKLGYMSQGTARVRIEVLDPKTLIELPASGGYYLQLGAFSEPGRADALLTKAMNSIAVEGEVQRENNVYRVRLGPFATFAEADSILNRLVSVGFSRPVLIRPPEASRQE
jgi:rare lipoprotein A